MGLRDIAGIVAARLRRLASDSAGNTLIIAAGFLIPMFALIGSGVDIGRVYVARSRMQQACDAASLAGRWSFGQGQTGDQASSEAAKFFNFNFKQGSYGTAAFTPTVTVTGSTTKIVTVTASTTMPMSLMGAFGFRPMTVSATCTAQQDFVNTDIVLVLDTTGSMADKAVLTDTQTKIQALRSAVLALYDQLYPIQQQLAAAGMRLRFSVVPYSGTVNVGKLLYAVDNSYIRNPALYQQNVCTSSFFGYCFASRMQPTSVSHSPAWLTSNSWGGCIEERQTVSTITSATTSIPAGALDLDVDGIPSSDAATRWPPYDPAAEQADSGSACPAEAKRLQSWTRADLNTYLNALVATGSTYHDIGMIWGARMISSAGVFADSPPTYNSMPTNKYIIFMTDGMLDTDPNVYSAYGVESADQRVTGGDLTTQDARHQQRFNLMCSRVKNMSASIWVVAFASTLNANLTNCASNPGQASTQGNSAALIQKFTEIGKNIGALRLTQ